MSGFWLLEYLVSSKCFNAAYHLYVIDITVASPGIAVIIGKCRVATNITLGTASSLLTPKFKIDFAILKL